MRVLLNSIFFLTIFAFANANESRFQGQANIPGDSFAGNCHRAVCRGAFSAATVNAEGTSYPMGDIAFKAVGERLGGTVLGECKNQHFYGTIQSSHIELSGRCSNGQTFYGFTYRPQQFVRGSCTDNGSFSAFYPGVIINAVGTCQ